MLREFFSRIECFTSFPVCVDHSQELLTVQNWYEIYLVADGL